MYYMGYSYSIRSQGGKYQFTIHKNGFTSGWFDDYSTCNSHARQLIRAHADR